MWISRPIMAIACAVATTLAASPARAGTDEAADYPARQITLVVPFPAGSVTDAVSRVIGNALSRTLGKPVVIENKAGAQATIGAAYVAHAKPDGYTLLVSSSVMYVARGLFKELSYDPVTSFEPVAGFGSTAMMFVVPTDSALRTIGDLAAQVKQGKAPVNMAYGSPSGQVAVALFSNVSNTTPTAISYRGIPQAMTDLMGGHVQVAVVDIGTGLTHVNANKARALAISSSKRYPGAPDTPTLQEAYPGAGGALETIIGIQAPAGTPKGVVQKLDAAIAKAMATEEVKTQFQALNTSVLSLSAADFGSRIERDNPRWMTLMQKAGITPQ